MSGLICTANDDGSIPMGSRMGLQIDADCVAQANVAPELLKALKRWQEFAKANGWTDTDHHDADGTGWISETDKAIAAAKEAGV